MSRSPISPVSIESDEAQVRALVRSLRRVAVLGCKTEAQSDQPAFYVPQYLVSRGVEVVPVPVYYPDVTEILGRRVYRRLADIPADPGQPLDLVDVFRRPQDIPPHLHDILAARPRAVWFQLGIRNDAAAARLHEAGITVVQDRCLLVDYRRYG